MKKKHSEFLGQITLEISKYSDNHYMMSCETNHGRRSQVIPYLSYSELLKDIRHELATGFDSYGEKIKKPKKRIACFPTSYGRVCFEVDAKKRSDNR